MVVIGNKHIRELTGEVVSDKTNQLRVVLVKSVKMHPIYKKRFVISKKYYIHDENNLSRLGDIVKFRENKPISKTKKWVLVETIK